MKAAADRGDAETYAIIGAAMAVHRHLGHGFLEAVYREALAMELEALAIPFEREVTLPIHYRGRRLGTPYRADLICHHRILLELKALQRLSGNEEAQVIN
jgi:GxxExxY protein